MFDGNSSTEKVQQQRGTGRDTNGKYKTGLGVVDMAPSKVVFV